ncbi:hypothetical protein C1752_00844 [Acaryochloris thomasi RCC1774]|uniref:Uncharacterized protein n=1 Tax=Acaryochloris thomasi RCC1774 TaxID=1764569 RepID=A0A2W1JNR8_9CYAN|nr:hypothetical protein [Acaryochloris thomasi]PZD74876.1 hypothetical protein C1752_00844 [Acaryochloris thomasi RCC1774]
MGQRQEARTYEIVCLEYQSDCLYAEMIQIIEKQQRCWLRPLALSLGCNRTATSDHHESYTQQIYDLRDCSDLLWPQTQLRAALDTELLPLLEMLQTDKIAGETSASPRANQQLHAFLHQLCAPSQALK